MVFPSVHLDLPPTWNLQQPQVQLNDEQLGLGQSEQPGLGSTSQIHPPVPQQKNIFSVNDFYGSSMIDRARMAQIPPPEPGLRCPRCDSTNTKFCYFNNYSLLQPRHFCKTCRRYWTRGGALRSVPVGGGCRRNKRNSKRLKSLSLEDPPPQHPVTMGVSSESFVPCLENYNENIGLMEQVQVQSFPFIFGAGTEQNSDIFYGEDVRLESGVKMEEISQQRRMSEFLGVNSDYKSGNNMECYKWVNFSSGLGSSSSAGADDHYFSRTSA